MTRISCQQLAPSFGDLDANRGLALAAIHEAVQGGADVVVLPELITSANWPLVPRPPNERPPEAVIAMATTIVGPDGWVAAESRAIGLVSADVNLGGPAF